MKQMLRKKDVWVLLAALIGAFACVTLIQFISGRIDGVASMVFLLAVFFVSIINVHRKYLPVLSEAAFSVNL